MSPATVSRVLNNNPNVSKEKKDRVLEVLEENNFIPNSIARSLSVQSTKTIGILTIDVRHINYSKITYAIERKMRELGYNVFLCNTGKDVKEQVYYLKLLAEKKVDGIALIGSAFNNDEVAQCIRNYYKSKPVIMLNSSLKEDNLHNIYGGTDIGIEKGMDYLHSLGHKDILFISESDNWLSELKISAYKRKLEEFGLTPNEKLVFTTEFGFQQGIDAVRYFNENNLTYTAILGCDDLTATGIIKELKRLGVSVPQDVSVVGYFNSIYALVSDPSLTSIDNGMEKIAFTMADVLSSVLKSKKIPKNIYLTPELVIRDSTAPPPHSK